MSFFSLSCANGNWVRAGRQEEMKGNYYSNGEAISNETRNKKMKPGFLAKTNYLNHYSLRLLVGNIMLILPTLCVALLVGIWGNLYFLWGPLLFVIIGLVLVLPSTYTIPRPSKERVAIDALLGGLAMMVILCFVLAHLKTADLKVKEPILRDQSSLVPKFLSPMFQLL